jgi:hypothetical protein
MSSNESDQMTEPAKPAHRTASGTSRTPGSKPGRTVQSRKIVNKRQTPWGLIVTTVVIVVLAVAVIGYAVNKSSSKTSYADPSKIPGIVHTAFKSQEHQNGVIVYQQSPPYGGPHSPYWADCTGTIYPAAIGNENAVHDLEHGAIWITYKPGLAADQLDVVTKIVAGKDHMLLSPYPSLKSNLSLQAWGYQLFLDSASDSRVKRFIAALRNSPKNTPEPGGECANPEFKARPSTPGNPWKPVGA